MLLLISVIAIIFCTLYYYFTRTFNYWKSKNVKGPRPIPLFGNYKDVALRKNPKGIFYNEMYDKYPDEKVVGFYQMTLPALLIRDLDIVKQIMIKDFEFFPDRGSYFSKEGLGENIFHSDLDTWKFLRNRFSSLFTSSKLKSIFNLLDKHGDKFVDYVGDMTMKQREQDVYKLIFKYTVATSMVSILGWDVDIYNDGAGWFDVLDKNLNNSHWQDIESLFPGFLTKFNQTIIAEKTRNICHEIIKTCLNERPDFDTTNIFNVKDVLVSLRKENKDIKPNDDETKPILEITDDLLAGQVFVFYTVGYINNTLALTHAMYQLAHNIEVQEKLRIEIDEVMKKHDGKLTYDVLKQMKYLEMVFKETLRKQPLTPGLIRNVSQDVTLEDINVTINRGTLIVISPYSIQNDEKYYPEPASFNPERFSSDNVTNQHPCNFLSFGAGRRGCMGQQLARIQFGICLVKLLHRFRVEISENTCKSITYDRYHMMLKPEPVRLQFVPRDN